MIRYKLGGKGRGTDTTVPEDTSQTDCKDLSQYSLYTVFYVEIMCYLLTIQRSEVVCGSGNLLSVYGWALVIIRGVNLGDALRITS